MKRCSLTVATLTCGVPYALGIKLYAQCHDAGQIKDRQRTTRDNSCWAGAIPCTVGHSLVEVGIVEFDQGVALALYVELGAG